ncbi:hypothetical protein JCM3775_005871 [Rhodotorula graminis]
MEDENSHQAVWGMRQPAQSSSTTSSAPSSAAPFRLDLPDPPSAQPSSEPGHLSQATPRGRSSSLTDAAPLHAPARRSSTSTLAFDPRLPVAPLAKSLADLPFDILERIGELLLPIIVPAHSSGDRTSSQEWTGQRDDVVRFRSTCRATWRATARLVQRVCNVEVPEPRFGFSPAHLWKGADAVALSAISLADEPYARLSTPSRFIPASKIRQLFAHWSVPGAWDQPCGGCSTAAELFAAKLAGMTRLESLALVWQDEEAVTRTSPYTVDTLPAEILVALSQHPTLRELYLCGIKLSRRLSSGDKLDDVPTLPSQLRTLTLNACHDSALELVTLAPGVTQMRVQRDFASPPRVQPDCFWDLNVWMRAEEVDIVGLSGTQSRPLFIHWRNELEILRSLSPPPFIPLRSLRLVEPYLLNDVRSIVLPTFALLPQLRHFAIFIWSSRDFGPSIYADLDFPSTRCHIFPLVKDRLFPYVPSLRALRWFGHDPHLRQLDGDNDGGADQRGRWAWSDDPRPLDLGSAGAAQELHGARLAGDPFSSPSSSSSPVVAGSRIVDGSRDAEDGDEVEPSGATGGGGRKGRAKPRKSVLEQLEALRAHAATVEVPAGPTAQLVKGKEKGKGKAVLRER